MAVYVVAQLTITDRVRYDAYVARFMPALVAHGGRLLAADEAVEIIEGSWDRSKVVILAFASEASFRTWYASDGYQAIVGDRWAGTVGTVLLVHGFG
jgi:uncharacterized protein (DUF1330 family)